MDLESTNGVYQIVCLNNARRYIGSTTRTFAARFVEHRIRLKTGDHTNTALQRDWNTFGPDAFRFEVVHVLTTRHEIRDAELHLLRSVKQVHGIGALYNTSLSVVGTSAERRREDGLPDRIEASLPADDPRFTELRALLASVRTRGKNSPSGRMLGEFARLGYLLTTGQLVVGGEPSEAVAAAQQDLAGVAAAQEHVEAALKDLEWG